MTNIVENTAYRVEKDSIGTKNVPIDAYYGIQSMRAQENFQMTGDSINPEMIKSLALLKKACAIANKEAGDIESEKADYIIKACDELYSGKYNDQFIVDPIQGGAGTSINMNANEVIANIAIVLSGGKKGDYSVINPNDDVNCAQSTNDVIPTAGKMTALHLLDKLENNLYRLVNALDIKASQFDNIVKMGRTQLEDAVPIRLGQEFSAYASVVKRSAVRIRKTEEELRIINMGGTAVGTGINTNMVYFKNIASVISRVTEEQYKQADNLIDATQNIDCFGAVSGAIKDCALSLSKIANDLRLMGSGPKTGFGELILPAMQNGSSIMPGKVNPVIPEVVNQAAFRVAGNDVTISMAVEAGQLELNAFEPVVFYSLFQSIDLLANAVDTFIINCVNGLQVNKKRCSELLDSSVGIVTALNPYIGYQKAAELAKTALKTGESVRELIVEKGIMDEKQLEKLLDPSRLTEPGTEECCKKIS